MSQKSGSKTTKTKKLLVNGFGFLYHLHSCGFKLKEQLKWLRVTFLKLASWFRTPVNVSFGEQYLSHRSCSQDVWEVLSLTEDIFLVFCWLLF